MNTQQAYDAWASQYDSNHNKTRDLEASALRECLGPLSFDSCLEIGCGTGKNTSWLASKAQHITAVDLSEEMMTRAREKVSGNQVVFKLADITKDWDFTDRSYDLAVFSLVLEHISDLGPIFQKTANALNPGGHVYIGELHPFKQYMGTKARFDTEEGQQVVTCFNHHVSDFLHAAKENGLNLFDFREYFDDDDRNGIPRVLAMVFRKGS